MPKISSFTAAIFDVDDTLLNNHPKGSACGLHERSRLDAMRAVGRRHNIPRLAASTEQDAIDAFRDAPEHSLYGALWQTLLVCGVVNGDVIERQHPLLMEMAELKDQLHESVLRREGVEVPGAVAFVRALANLGFEGKMAIASTAMRRDVIIALEVMGLSGLFPAANIITREESTHPKPHPDSYNRAFESLGLPAGTKRRTVLAFEDDHRGVMSAEAAGLFTCAITTRYTKKELAAQPVPPDLIADSYAEFAQLLGISSFPR
jgi:HAD superfamily hydrolase (TIGR01509 family)